MFSEDCDFEENDFKMSVGEERKGSEEGVVIWRFIEMGVKRDLIFRVLGIGK